MSSATAAATQTIRRIRDEVATVLRFVATSEGGALSDLAAEVAVSSRVFVLGAGRSGLAMRMIAMRLMHLGYSVFVVGDTTTPAIGAGDLLLVASGSGSTTGIVRAAATARESGARIATISTTPTSPLADLSDVIVIVPAADKLNRTRATSVQYAGSLFEQSVLLIGDALFHLLWESSGLTAEDIWPRHANLE